MISFFYDLFFVLPLSIIALALTLPYMGMGANAVILYVLVILSALFCTVIKHIKTRSKWLLPLVPVFILLVVLYLKEPEDRIPFLLAYRFLFIAVLLAAAAFFIMIFAAANRWGLRAIVAALIAYMAYAMMSGSNPPKIAVTMSLLLLFHEIVLEVHRHWNKQGYTDEKAHLVFLAPFLLVPVILISILNMPEKPYDWAFAVNFWNGAVYRVKMAYSLWWEGDNDFWANRVGFSSSEGLFGNLSGDEMDVIDLKPVRSPGPQVYLAGRVFDTFDGRRWSDTNFETLHDSMFDVLETSAAVYAYDPGMPRNYIRDAEIEIRFNIFNSETLFAPSKSILRSDRLSNLEYQDLGGTLSFYRKMGYDTHYRVRYLRVNRNQDIFKEFLRAPHPMNEAIWNESLYQNGLMGHANYNYEAYLEHRAQLYHYYLQPVTLSPRLRAYMDDLYAGAANDIEKLERLESLLSSFAYTQTPGDMPSNIRTPEEFLDYFLLEKREGYCTYFATAFALLARAEGIPTRYVQGFYVRRDDDEVTTVTSNMVHVWPECYIDGYGFLAFEPTPGFHYTTGWRVQLVGTGEGEGEGTGIPHHAGTPVFAGSTFEDFEGVDMDPAGHEQKTAVLRWSYLYIPALLLLAAALLFFITDRLVTALLYRRLSPAGKFKALLARTLHLLAILGYPIEGGETLEEFGNRVSGYAPAPVLTLLRDYEEVAYGQRPVDVSLVDRSELAVTELIKVLASSRKKWLILFDRAAYPIFRRRK